MSASSGRLLGFCNYPARIYFLDGRDLQECSASYNRVEEFQGGLRAKALVKDETGLRFEVDDFFSESPVGIEVSREVKVLNGLSSNNGGFFSAFEVELDWGYSDLSFFVPGVWYNRNEHTPDGSIGNPQRTVAKGCWVRREVLSNIVREDRLPLPLFMVYNTKAKEAFSMLHAGATGETVEEDDVAEVLIDARLGFGSIGEYHCDERIWMCFWYPGSEGDVSYPPMWVLPVVCNKQCELPFNPLEGKFDVDPSKEKWTYRFHPLRDNYKHNYRVLLFCLSGLDYRESLRDTWRESVSIYEPCVRRVNLEKVKEVSVLLLAKMARKLNETGGFDVAPVGIPTWIDCFTGKTGRLQNTFAIGFVGRNIEAAYLFLLLGRREGLEKYMKLGREIIDFWTYCSGMGLSHTEFDAPSMGWVDSGKDEQGLTEVFLRQLSEAHLACLKAWKLESELGVNHEQWFRWVKSFADWAVSVQNVDGSFFRKYKIDGRPALTVTSDCIHIVPFLLEFGKTVGNCKYKEAAFKAAEYLWEEFHSKGHFIGGTLDNPNCYDKEACILALEAYLEMFKETQDSKWLEAAKLAADFAETWIYMWDVPMPLDDPERFYPFSWTTVGLQVITTGCSAVDVYLSRSSRLFEELSLLTGDEHYHLIAEILHFNTKGVVQTGNEPHEEGYFGYAEPGFQIEHWGMGRGRGFGLNSGWLPWVSVNHLVDIFEWDRQKSVF